MQPIRRRLSLVTVVSGIGAALFVPFLRAGMTAGGQPLPASFSRMVFLFTLCTTLAAGLLSWAGLRFADRAGLPMPLMRAWDQRVATQPGSLKRILTWGLFSGLAAGVLIGGLVHALHIPANPGSLAVRLLTVFFAAVVTEIVVHLFAMSGLVLLLRRKWVAILLSSVIFVLIFHSGHIGSLWMTALVISANFAFGTLTGWLYGRYGFECAVLAHAIAHLVALGWN